MEWEIEQLLVRPLPGGGEISPGLKDQGLLVGGLLKLARWGREFPCLGWGHLVSISTLGFVYRVLDVWVDALAHQDDLLLIKCLYCM